MPPPRPRRPDVLIAASAVALVAAIVLAVLAVRVLTAPDDRVPAGVSIAGIPVGGLTAEQAERGRGGSGPSRRAREVEIRMAGEPGFPLRVPVAELAPTPRARLAVQAALDQPSVTDRLLSEIGVRERTRDLPLRYRLDGERLAGRVAAVAAQGRPPRRARQGRCSLRQPRDRGVGATAARSTRRSCAGACRGCPTGSRCR